MIRPNFRLIRDASLLPTINLITVLLIVFIATVCGVTIAETPIKDNEYVIFYHNDILGSPITVSDGKGRVLWYENTGPYGEVLGRNASDGITSVGNPIVESADSRIGLQATRRIIHLASPT